MRGPSPISIVGEHFEPAAAARREVVLHHFKIQEGYSHKSKNNYIRNNSKLDSRVYLSAVCLNKRICSFLMLARTFSMFFLRLSMLESLRETEVTLFLP